MALTDYYVDPVGGSDSTGTGSSGAPWKTTQKALNTIVQGAGGDRINIKSTGDDVLTATLSLTTYGTPTAAKPLIFMGYTTAQGDGGVGGISGNSGNFSILSSSAAGISFVNMHLHHTGTASIVSLTSNNTNLTDCELDHCTATTNSQAGIVHHSYFHDLGGTYGLFCEIAHANRFDGSVTCPSGVAIFPTGEAALNEIVVKGACVGIKSNSDYVLHLGNSIYGSSGTGQGLNDNGYQGTSFVNNIVEGFSGVGGKSYVSTGLLAKSAGNRSYNSNTHYSYGTVASQGTDYTDAASNFNSPGTGDLSLASTSPAKGVSYPGTLKGSPTQTSYRDPGALQHQDAGGGGGGANLLGTGTLVA